MARPWFATAASFAALAWLDYVDSLAPVAHWRLDETSGTTLTDRIAGATAPLTGAAGTSYTFGAASLVADDSDAAITFNGGYAASGAAQKWSLGSGDFSVFSLVKTTATGVCVPFGIRSPGGFDVLFLFMISQTAAGKAAISGWNGSNQIVQIGTTTITDGKPHSLGLRYDSASNTMYGYVDGVLGCTFTPLVAQPRPTGSAMSVRIANNLGTQAYNGIADEFILFNKLITPTNMAMLDSYAAAS